MHLCRSPISRSCSIAFVHTHIGSASVISPLPDLRRAMHGVAACLLLAPSREPRRRSAALLWLQLARTHREITCARASCSGGTRSCTRRGTHCDVLLARSPGPERTHTAAPRRARLPARSESVAHVRRSASECAPRAESGERIGRAVVGMRPGQERSEATELRHTRKRATHTRAPHWRTGSGRY